MLTFFFILNIYFAPFCFLLLNITLGIVILLFIHYCVVCFQREKLHKEGIIFHLLPFASNS